MRACRVVWLIGLAAVVAACGGDSDAGGDTGDLAIGEVIARDASGFALRLGQTVTTEGIATVDAPVFANNKLKQFIQADGDGAMVFHATSAGVDAFVAGDRLRVTGVVIQADPTSDNNRAEGTVAVDITAGSVELVSSGNPVPDPIAVTLAEIVADGDAWTGTLVLVVGVQKTAGDWPEPSSRSAEVTISDDGGTSTVTLRMQRNTIDDALTNDLAAIGGSAFNLTGIVVQDDTNDDGDLLDGYEIWLRGAQDVDAG